MKRKKKEKTSKEKNNFKSVYQIPHEKEKYL